MIEINIILFLMILAAVAAIEIEDLLSSVIALGAVGFGLTLAFLLLGAPDLAITQLVVEILALIILIRATIGIKVVKETIKTRTSYVFLGVLFLFIFLWFSYKVLAQLPIFGLPFMKIGKDYITHALPKTGAANIVSSVILDFRAYDTLGEATILFTSVIGVLAILRQREKNK